MKKLFCTQQEKLLKLQKSDFSLKGLLTGSFIPFTFILEMSYNPHDLNKESGIHISKEKALMNNNTAGLSQGITGSKCWIPS